MSKKFNRFIQHVQIVEDTETGAKFVIDSQNVCGIVTDLLNSLNDENVRLKIELEDEISYKNKFKKESEDYLELYLKVTQENKELVKELYESERDYFLETYYDNSVRAEGKIAGLDNEFRERFGENEWWKND